MFKFTVLSASLLYGDVCKHKSTIIQNKDFLSKVCCFGIKQFLLKLSLITLYRLCRRSCRLVATCCRVIQQAWVIWFSGDKFSRMWSPPSPLDAFPLTLLNTISTINRTSGRHCTRTNKSLSNVSTLKDPPLITK